MKTCPACAEAIPSDVETCPHCGISVHDYSSGGGSAAGGRKTSTLMIIFLIGGGILGVLIVCGGILAALLLPAVQQAREAARRSQCKNNLKQIGLALHNYHDVYGTFPPAIVTDDAGKPMHSWRVLILPFIDCAPLYNQYDFSEPWDGPSNSRLLARMPSVYTCPSHANAPGNTDTAYVGVFGEHCVFHKDGATKISDITDGTSNTLIVGESTGAGIPWMKPEDIDITTHPALGDAKGFSSDHVGGVQFLMCDGSVRYISLNINPATLQALFTRDGGEPVGEF